VLLASPVVDVAPESTLEVPCVVLQRVAACCSVLQGVVVCWVCCSVLQCWRRRWLMSHLEYSRGAVCCVAACCSVLLCVAECYGVLRCVAVCCSVLQCVDVALGWCYIWVYFWGAVCCVAACCSVLQCVAVCCSVLQRVVMCWFRRYSISPLSLRSRCRVLQRVVACCSVLQRVAASCSVLQHVAMCCGVLNPPSSYLFLICLDRNTSVILISLSYYMYVPSPSANLSLSPYGVASMTRLLKMIGLFCKRDL